MPGKTFASDGSGDGEEARRQIRATIQRGRVVPRALDVLKHSSWVDPESGTRWERLSIRSESEPSLNERLPMIIVRPPASPRSMGDGGTAPALMLWTSRWRGRNLKLSMGSRMKRRSARTWRTCDDAFGPYTSSRHGRLRHRAEHVGCGVDSVRHALCSIEHRHVLGT